MHFHQVTALAASLSLASAQSIRGFNSGSLLGSGAGKSQSDFQSEFQNMKNLQGTNGAFSNTRLYTMIQGGTTNTPISAIPAAIASNTGLLLGLWASGGQEGFNNELAALHSAMEQYGSSFANLVRGISVGSEDLYRISVTGIENDSGIGAGPDVVANYIGQLRKAISGTILSSAQVGHVDTWNAWTNSSNSAVADACDWVGVDEYPYYESQNTNPISNAHDLFYSAYDKTSQATGKPVWVTESGWPTTGPTTGEAVASVANAETFWQDVYCTLPADVPVYWYTQVDSSSGSTPNFGVTGTTLSTSPLYDLSCKAVSSSSSSSASSTQASTKTASGSTATTTGKSSHDTAVVPIATSTSFALTGTEMVSAPTSAKQVPGPLHSTLATSVSDGSVATSYAAPPYPTAPSVAESSHLVGTATGIPIVPTASTTAGSPRVSTTAAPFNSNGADNVQISMVLLAVPAILALMI